MSYPELTQPGSPRLVTSDRAEPQVRLGGQYLELDGEHLHVLERLVVSPHVGIFQPGPLREVGCPVDIGTSLGTVSEQDVRSPFAGCLMGILAHPGERVRPGQPVAWLRVERAE